MVKILKHSAGERAQTRWFGSFSGTAGMIGIIAGLAALCGWSVLPAYIIRNLWFVSQVHPNAGLGFILVGFSLRLALFDGITPWVHTICRLFRISVGVLGLLSLSNIWFHWNLGIDKFIVRDPTEVMPGAMPAAAALCLYLLGCALILLTARRSLICQILSLSVITITVVTLVANIYTWLAPQALPDYLIMPVGTAVLLLVLSLGVVNSNASHALITVITSKSLGGAMARRLLPASILIPIALGFLRLKGQDAGWFGPVLGLVLHVVATIILLALFVWWNAAALDRIASENRRFESAAQDAQTTWLEILGHVSNPTFAHDLQGNLTFFNAAAERLFELPAAEALHKNFYALVTPQSAEAARSILSGRLIGSAPRPESLVLRTGAGEQRYPVLTTMICHDGNPAGFFSVVAPASLLFEVPDPVSAG